MVQSVFVEQAAELLGVSRRTVYYRIRDGKLRTIRTRGGTQRVLLSSIEELLREEHADRDRAKHDQRKRYRNAVRRTGRHRDRCWLRTTFHLRPR
jgi:excisionase family DNA binding protein